MPRSPGQRKSNSRQRRREAIELRLGVDGSEVVHAFSDGWTIRKVATYRDELREGVLMGSDLAVFLERDARLGAQRLPAGDSHHSLRDPNNYPHATFAFQAPESSSSGWLGDVVGHGDRRPLRLADAARILDWIQCLPYDVEIASEALAALNPINIDIQGRPA